MAGFTDNIVYPKFILCSSKTLDEFFFSIFFSVHFNSSCKERTAFPYFPSFVCGITLSFRLVLCPCQKLNKLKIINYFKKDLNCFFFYFIYSLFFSWSIFFFCIFRPLFFRVIRILCGIYLIWFYFVINNFIKENILIKLEESGLL